ncbi:hypothetical protein K7X08_001492 [Anisodus acutangulus]|uniref:Uncharacterized protein n=1 Tax=Anisodus acutangulus TaxID=402998 RepID=A0A9Q1MNU4_9SOLA|nr:hypothetical protein K7X08_001492 [Anisodus acutangulus]
MKSLTKRCYEFSASGTFREAGKAAYTKSPRSGHFSYSASPMILPRLKQINTLQEGVMILFLVHQNHQNTIKKKQ